MRSLEINTEFFEDQQPSMLNHQQVRQKQFDKKFLQKATAVITIDSKVRTMILKNLFRCWTKIKEIGTESAQTVNVKIVEERIRRNLSSIKQMNRSISGSQKMKRKGHQSLSATCSNLSLRQSKESIFNQALEKVKLKKTISKQSLNENNLTKRVGKIQRMLQMIKRQHKKTETHENKPTKIHIMFKKQKNCKDSCSNSDVEECLHQIQKLKQQIEEIKLTQHNLWDQKQALSRDHNQKYSQYPKRSRVCSQSHYVKSHTNLLFQKPQETRPTTDRLPFQSKIYNPMPVPINQVILQPAVINYIPNHTYHRSINSVITRHSPMIQPRSSNIYIPLSNYHHKNSVNVNSHLSFQKDNQYMNLKPAPIHPYNSISCVTILPKSNIESKRENINHNWQKRVFFERNPGYEVKNNVKRIND